MIWCSAIDGEYVTWAERTEDEETNIFLYHIPTGTTRTIVESADYLTFTMDISGDHIAWKILRPDEPTVPVGIGLYTISTGSIEELPVDDCTIGQIAMDGDLIAFSGLDFSPLKSDDKQSAKNTIFLYSIANRTQQVLCKQSVHQIEPAIGEGYVAWRTTGEGYCDTITIYSLADRSQFTLSPPDGASYAQPSVGRGMVVASLYYKDAKTSGPYKTDIVATTLPGMETTTLSLPETSRRYSPRSNSEWIVWEERYSGSFGKIVLYNTKNRTMIDPVHIGGSLHNPKIGNNHFIATEYDEVLGVSKLRLFSFTAEEQYSPGGDAAEEGDSKNAAATVFNGYHLPDGMLIILIGIIAGVMAVAVLLKRENR